MIVQVEEIGGRKTGERQLKATFINNSVQMDAHSLRMSVSGPQNMAVFLTLADMPVFITLLKYISVKLLVGHLHAAVADRNIKRIKCNLQVFFAIRVKCHEKIISCSVY